MMKVMAVGFVGDFIAEIDGGSNSEGEDFEDVINIRDESNSDGDEPADNDNNEIGSMGSPMKNCCKLSIGAIILMLCFIVSYETDHLFHLDHQIRTLNDNNSSELSSLVAGVGLATGFFSGFSANPIFYSLYFYQCMSNQQEAYGKLLLALSIWLVLYMIIMFGVIVSKENELTALRAASGTAVVKN